MYKYLISSVLGTLLILNITACSPAQKSTKSKATEVSVLTSVYTPVIRGAGAPRGIKIGIKILSLENTSIDSIHYEGFTKPVEIINTSQDTIWVEANFYPKRTNSPENQTEFEATSCILYYSNQKKPSTIQIEKMELVTDPHLWE